MCAASSSVVYIHEPFKPVKYRPGICGAKFHYWFTYITDENENYYYQPLKKTTNLSYNLAAALRYFADAGGMKKIIKGYFQFMGYRRNEFIPLLKDPIALLSADWLATSFDMNIVVMIRHPAAFISSLKRLNWTHPFTHFLEQPLLMRDHLSSFEAEINEYANKDQDIIDQACLLWRILYYVVHKYRSIHSHWSFLRYEDIAKDPIQQFSNLYQKLGLEYTHEVETQILEYSVSPNQTQLKPPDFNLSRLNSKKNIWAWKSRLNHSEITYVRKRVEDISHHFYKDSDWESPY